MYIYLLFGIYIYLDLKHFNSSWKGKAGGPNLMPPLPKDTFPVPLLFFFLSFGMGLTYIFSLQEVLL